ncbi:MAG: Stp1/IreP family PP2C-type Ser/Thr phosphatase [Burkholderiaceae bacterium]|nr:Stp1/IreP family PP2C-type Ser/Thr phosphatase [Burkholderiaceae bacterium]
MAHLVELQVAAKTDTGLVRPHNEDSFAYSKEAGLVVLADGMGGYSAGEVASAIATSTLHESLTEQLRNHDWNGHVNHVKFVQQLLTRSVSRANTAILDSARSEPRYRGMGTTLVAAIFHADRVTVAHVGDSRAYRLRRGTLTQITRDHSVLQEQIDAGLIEAEQARFSPHRNLVTKAMGIDYEVQAEIHDHQTEPDDLYLLCTDGLSDMLSTKEIAQILHGTSSNLDAACDALIARANENGGKDNTSVILVGVRTHSIAKQGVWTKALRRLKLWFKKRRKSRRSAQRKR